ncbi:hypothetical protein NC652_005946 [Populus alba x Populus x berolinensis]|nr:hypothetical protein NC652_005946 [Populus alba x Populus x berolinensis]
MGLASTVQGSGDHHLGWIPTTRSSICNKGSIAKCMAENGKEFEMNTKIDGHEGWLLNDESEQLFGSSLSQIEVGDDVRSHEQEA